MSTKETLEREERDLLIRIDEKVEGLERDVKHMADTHRRDYATFKEEVKSMIVGAVEPLEKEIMDHRERIKQNEDAVKDWAYTKRKIIGGGAVLGFIWPILWVLIQVYLIKK